MRLATPHIAVIRQRIELMLVLQWGLQFKRSKGGFMVRERERERAGWEGGVRCAFGKWFTKNTGVDHFSNFYKGFSSQHK